MTKEKELPKVYTIDLNQAAKEASRHDEEYQALKEKTPPEFHPVLEAGYSHGFASGVMVRDLRAKKIEAGKE